MAQIVVSRPRSSYMEPLSLEIILDGQQVAKLRRRGEVAIDVVPGPHTVKTRVDWKLSPLPRTLISRTVELDVADSDRVHLTCRSPKLYLFYALYFYWLFIRPDRYIEIEVRIDRDEPQGATR